MQEDASKSPHRIYISNRGKKWDDNKSVDCNKGGARSTTNSELSMKLDGTQQQNKETDRNLSSISQYAIRLFSLLPFACVVLTVSFYDSQTLNVKQLRHSMRQQENDEQFTLNNGTNNPIIHFNLICTQKQFNFFLMAKMKLIIFVVVE